MPDPGLEKPLTDCYVLLKCVPLDGGARLRLTGHDGLRYELMDAAEIRAGYAASQAPGTIILVAQITALALTYPAPRLVDKT